MGRKDEFSIWKEEELTQGATFKELNDNRTEPFHEVNPKTCTLRYLKKTPKPSALAIMRKGPMGPFRSIESFSLRVYLL